MDDETEQKNHDTKNQTRNILLGKYEMGRLLGQGTFAKVYYGKNIITHESVAIKVINKDQVKKDGLMEQIKREISVMRLVHHPNIVELKEVMATKSKVFFIMEYINGGELFEKITKRKKLEEETARKYFRQLISAVEFCHSRGVSHRDLKPENLLLDQNGDLKVSDFGLSALPESLRIDGLLHTQCGTPAYVAPEILRKKGYDGAKADIWSCGVILFVLLSGYLPFRADNIMKMYRKVFKGEYEFPPWLSCDAKSLISKLLVVDPDKRISISDIRKSTWFRHGVISSSTTNQNQEVVIGDISNNEDLELVMKSSSAPFYNAFEFIASMSTGFDLSSLFESKKKCRSIFMSKCSASTILAKLKGLGKKFSLTECSLKDYKVKIVGKDEGRKGRLEVVAEVFEVAAEVAVVEFSKVAGDTMEYVNFCEDVRPALKDIVWSWQGEINSCS